MMKSQSRVFWVFIFLLSKFGFFFKLLSDNTTTDWPPSAISRIASILNSAMHFGKGGGHAKDAMYYDDTMYYDVQQNAKSINSCVCHQQQSTTI